MNNLIGFALKQNNIPIFKKLWSIQSIFTKKYETEVWLDFDGNTLAHYVGLHHDSKLWEFIKDKPINLNHLNKSGKSPLHLFIERSFVQQIKKTKYSITEGFFSSVLFYLLSKFNFNNKYIREFILDHQNKKSNDNVSISFNKELLINLTSSGANINQFLEFPDRKELGWVSSDYGSFSRKDNMGSPLELLVYYFWEFILYGAIKKNNHLVINEYNSFFETLSSLGANLNLIVQGNTNDKEITDVMTSYPSRIVSIFFTKFISNEVDYIAIKPFFINENIDFMGADDSGNTILHTLFARISAKKHKFSDEFCEKLIQDIAENKNLTTRSLELKNNFNMTPIQLLRGEANHLRKYFDSFLLYEQLNRTLSHSPELKENRTARKI